MYVPACFTCLLHSRFVPDKGFSGADPSQTRDGPVQFERDAEDPFNLNLGFLKEAKMAKRPTEDRSEGSGVGGSGDSKGGMREARECRGKEGSGGIGVYKLVARCALGAEHGTASHSRVCVHACACMHSGNASMGQGLFFTANLYAVFIFMLFSISCPSTCRESSKSKRSKH